MAKHLALFALLLGIPFVTAKANFLATSSGSLSFFSVHPITQQTTLQNQESSDRRNQSFPGPYHRCHRVRCEG